MANNKNGKKPIVSRDDLRKRIEKLSHDKSILKDALMAVKRNLSKEEIKIYDITKEIDIALKEVSRDLNPKGGK